jgi:putative addiction module component (TIGR02574 family)
LKNWRLNALHRIGLGMGVKRPKHDGDAGRYGIAQRRRLHFPFSWRYYPAGGYVMPTYENLLANVAQLPVADRIQLIDDIWDALPPLSIEWTTEIQRRCASYDAGEVEPVSWNHVKTEALRRARDN